MTQQPIPLALGAFVAASFALVLAASGGDRAASAQSAPEEAPAAGDDKATLPLGAPELELPIACEPGRTCFIQSYVDHDPGPGVRDYRCQAQTYNDHAGTDFRIPTLAEASRTAVLAAAAGTVLAVRGTMPDHRVGAIDRSNLNGIECGNGVLIDHGGGWETQYCHLQSGSLQVAKGEQVEAGQVLGLVGLSGNTEFTHLHLTLRHANRTIDPFTATAAADACDEPAVSLWSEAVSAQLGYNRSAVLNTGFAAAAVTMDQIEAGSITPPGPASPALVAYARAINLRVGDVLALEVIGPDGRVLTTSATEPMDANKAQWMMFSGRRLRGEAWPQGRYTGRVSITSNGETVLQERFVITL